MRGSNMADNVNRAYIYKDIMIRAWSEMARKIWRVSGRRVVILTQTRYPDNAVANTEYKTARQGKAGCWCPPQVLPGLFFFCNNFMIVINTETFLRWKTRTPYAIILGI
jgi:hypothetical protein